MNGRTIALLSLALAFGLETRAAALRSVVHVVGDGHTFMQSPSQFVGTAVFRLNDEPVDAIVTTDLLSMVSLPNGLVLARTAHTFDFGNGDVLYTSDHARGVPLGVPGVFALYSSLRIVGGTGAFEGAGGHLHGLPESTINFILGEAIWTCEGVITHAD